MMEIMEEEENNSVSFSVDAGIINRLGYELVGRVETAVSELIKNAYDADATKVVVDFIGSENIGGTLEIKDDGNGMSRQDFEKGFMRLSSTSKVHEPFSPVYERRRAGKKGIGRFATQRLGKKLTIVSKTKEEERAIKIVIDWSDYKIDKDLEEIRNSVEYVECDFSHGTTLIIEDLREPWTDAQIRRVFRYVSELLQPDYLQDIDNGNGNGKLTKEKTANLIASQKDETFEVFFNNIDSEGNTYPVINQDTMIFDRAIATVEGFVDEDYDGYISIDSDRFGIEQELFSIGSQPKSNQTYRKWNIIKGIHFRAYYFIYNKPEYYVSMTKMELNRIGELSRRLGSIRLYRNGFRVLPYGEPNNDWLNLDSRSRSQSGVNAPLGNKNFFGFVQIEEQEKELFGETASREGLFETKALDELRDFVFKSLSKTRDIIANKLLSEKKQKKVNKQKHEANHDKKPEEILDELDVMFDDKDEESNNNEGGKKNKEENKKEFKEKIEQLKQKYTTTLDELAMLRVWAGLGLAIGEFTHDVRQFTANINGHLVTLDEQDLDDDGNQALDSIEETLKVLNSYLAFFDEGTARSESRNTVQIRIEEVVEKFVSIIHSSKIEVETTFNDFRLYTIPINRAEIYTILFNLYSNAVKAISRTRKSTGKIKIICGRTEDLQSIYLEFLDNGDGVPKEQRDRIFEGFYSPHSNASSNISDNENLTGRGLGLKIISDVLEAYKGGISVEDSPIKEYKTCFRVEIPALIDE
jgi:signal transduction histidine kinase